MWHLPLHRWWRIEKKIEPHSVNSQRCFAILKTLRETNTSVVLYILLIIPCLTDNYNNTNSLFYDAKESDVHYVLTGSLYLKEKPGNSFFILLTKGFSHLNYGFLAPYKKGEVNKEYKNSLYKMVYELRDRHSLPSNYSNTMREN